ncbi:hypothetical protein THRCLA_08514 [Thraustotheca clavata]|uniref:DEAD/DEAH box RNA helicase n=1 Tax=Thraustotheca clavata TaxID=74557 RepID=A0A1V9Z596_9STRA|nr:hypothetical protein THRCLA_08514 [Thraustotheca clavata]
MTTHLRFVDLPLSKDVQERLHERGFLVPSPIQAKSLPIALFGNDLIAQAKSGMGKTLVFATVAVELTHRLSTSWSLIIAPTREIALQIEQVVQSLIEAPVVVSCIGGLPIENDEMALRNGITRIVVGTPGRLKALVQRKSFPLNQVHLMVMDEVDKLLQSDFDAEMKSILTALPLNKQMIACSATYTPDQLAHVASLMQNPQFVCVRGPDNVTTEYINSGDTEEWRNREENSKPEVWLRGVQQYYMVIKPPSQSLDDVLRLKIEQLCLILATVKFYQCITFTNDKFRAEALTIALAQQDYPAVCVTGALSQEQRIEAMTKFRQFEARIMVSTDLTARGIDVDRVNLVVNLDLPKDPATYLHRVGRAGRYGGQISFSFYSSSLLHGVAVTMLLQEEIKAIQALADLFKMKIHEMEDDCSVQNDLDDTKAFQAQDLYAQTDLPASLYQRLQPNEPQEMFSPKATFIPENIERIPVPIKEINQVKEVQKKSTKHKPLTIPDAKPIKEAVKDQTIDPEQVEHNNKVFEMENATYEEWCRSFR